MNGLTKHVNNQEGSTIVIALIVLVVVTIIGVFAINTSITEKKISTNQLLHKLAFYCAESGWEFMVNWLDDQYPHITSTVNQNGNLTDCNYAAQSDFAGVEHNLPGYSTEFKRYLYSVSSTGTTERGSSSDITVTAGKIVYVGGY